MHLETYLYSFYFLHLIFHVVIKARIHICGISTGMGTTSMEFPSPWPPVWLPRRWKFHRRGCHAGGNSTDVVVKISNPPHALPFENDLSRRVHIYSTTYQQLVTRKKKQKTNVSNVENFFFKCGHFRRITHLLLNHLFQCAVGQFVVVRIQYDDAQDEHSRVYVGRILEIPFANRLRIRFLREYLGRKHTFTFLDPSRRPDDIELVRVDAIVKVLPAPREQRGIFYFPDNCY